MFNVGNYDINIPCLFLLLTKKINYFWKRIYCSPLSEHLKKIILNSDLQFILKESDITTVK